MKKLMVAIAAVATAFGLYADGQALNTAFVADNEQSGPFTPAAPGWAEYTGEATKLTITTDTPKMLDISTGTAALKRNVANDGAAWELNSTDRKNLYFDTTIDFKGQVLDDVPDVTGGKLAIFALDGTEIDGLADGTNVYVYAGYGTDSKALYLLSGFDADFPESAHQIVVKTWANVFSEGTRSGFILYIQNGEAKTALVDADIAQVQGVFTWDGAKWVAVQDISATGSYLGGAAASVDGTYGKWVNQRSLFLNLDVNAETTEKFTTLDFQGNAKIAGVSITADAPVNFPADSFSMNVEADVTFTISPDTVTLVGNKLVSPIEQSVTITPEEKDILVVKNGDVDVPNINGTFTFTFKDGGSLYVHGADKKATVTINETDYPCESIDKAIEKAEADGVTSAVIKLDDGATLDKALAFNNQNFETVLDLNGKTITFTSETAYLSNAGKLKIIDPLTGGKIVAFVNPDGLNPPAVDNSGELAIVAGTFDGEVTGDGTFNVTGGAFDQANNDKDILLNYITDEYEIAGEEGDLYWTVVPAAPKTFSVTAAPAAPNSKLTVQVDGEDIPGDANVYTAEIGKTIVVTYTADEGYEFEGEATKTGSFEEDDDKTFATAPVPTIKTFKLTLPEVEHATAVVSNDTEDITAEIDAIAYGTKVTVYWTAEDGWKITEGATEEITMTEAKTAQEPEVEADAKEVPGEEILPATEKDAYRAWAEKNGVKDTDTQLGNELVVAYKLGVNDVKDAAEAVAAAQSKADEFLKDVDLSALAAGGSIEDALKNLSLPAGLSATLVEVPQTEIETTASLFRLMITANSAN